MSHHDSQLFVPPPDERDERPHHAQLRGPQVRDLTFTGRDDKVVRVRGRLLAFGTSERDEHSHPVDLALPVTDLARYADKNHRCSACRWFEVHIAQVEADITEDCNCDAPDAGLGVEQRHRDDCGTEPPSGRYLVVTAGRTIVPGEMDFRRAEFTDSPYDVVELLVQYRDNDNRRFIPQISARAIAQAAGHDENLRDAYSRALAA